MDPQQESAASSIDQDKLQDLKQAKSTKKSKKPVLIVLLVILLIAAAGFGGWYYRDSEAKKQLDAKDAEISQLQQENTALQTQLDEANAAAADSQAKTPTEEDLANIEAAIESGNYASLEGFMATEVTVIQAATECCGARTPAEAVKDMAYLDDATEPWNFDLGDEVLKTYQEGDYTQYFPEGALVGKSKNNFVVAVTFDDDAKISGIFMVGDASLL